MFGIKLNKVIEKGGPAPIIYVICKISLGLLDEGIEHLPLILLDDFSVQAFDKLNPNVEEFRFKKYGPK